MDPGAPLTVVGSPTGEGKGPSQTTTLECDPVGGNHPLPEDSCARLAVMPQSFEPVPEDTMCTMIFGGPEQAHVYGTFQGEPVDARFERSNGCELARWDSLEPLFKVVVAGEGRTGSVRNPAFLLRAALVLLLLALIFGPYGLRATVPIWIPFLILAGLELNFFIDALRAGPPGPPSRGPQPIDEELYGYAQPEEDELWSDGEPNEIEPAAGRVRRRPWRRLVAGAAVLAALGLVFWIVDSRTGWDGLGDETRVEAVERFSDEASRIAGKPVTIECDPGEHVGIVQHADGAALVGGDRRVPDAGALLRPLPAGVQGRGEVSQTARAMPSSRTRPGTCAACATRARPSASRSQSGVDARPAARAVRGAGAPADAPAARRERPPRRRGLDVRRPAGMPRQWVARPRSGELAFP